MKNVMVINMGLKSIRCIIFNEMGTKLYNEALPIKTAISAEKVEQDPEEWWQSAKELIIRGVRECKEVCIDYITVTASASCLVCIDENGVPLMRASMVSDKRAEDESLYIAKMDEFKEVYKETLTDMSASLMLPRILWVKRNMPEAFNRTDKFMTPNDYMLFMLSGVCATDYFNAIKYHYNAKRGYYPEKLLKALEISKEKLPEVLNPGDTIGQVLPNLAKELGFNKEVEVVISSYDAICSFIGSGASEDGDASDVSGTVTVLRALSRNKNPKNNSLIYNLPLYSEEAYIIGGSNNLGGGLIEWVKQCYYQNEVYPYEIMEKEAGESVLGAKGLVFLPYLLGERAPIWDDNARGVFFGIERMHTRKDMTRAVFESTGYIDMDMIAAVEETGTKIKSVRLSGGLARINLISQIKADILGRDILVLSEFETTSTGAAMMVLLGKGYFSDLREAAERFVSVRMIIKPNMTNHQKYIYMYELYKDTYRTVKELYVRRKKIIKEMVDDREVRIENL
ncbi:xylulokinase [Kineothrix sp. MB12-C1]|uniref:xylulokinase n=1 Tax=Kineothrix sp. MB12-C1 TaxID=3070215 RepID=UPI0027D32776|nr:FGGY-family carbohydrate kinase [Kineothrix sp. MB12-C1]WMC93872.1 FGGY-family carbohydrate kinase [Kineothrix sp. MB12-C1]